MPAPGSSAPAGAAASGSFVHPEQRTPAPQADISPVLLGSGGQREALRGQLAQAEDRVRSLERELAERAKHDPRTRLLALDAFLESAEIALRAGESAGDAVAAVVIDVDGFRELNARLGAKAGDFALGALANRLRRLTRDRDVLGRSGADEITILMPATDLAGAHRCCDRLIRELAPRTSRAPGTSRSPPASPPTCAGQTLGELLAAAHEGLDRARALGGSRAAVRLDGGVEDLASPAQTAVIEALANTLLERDRYTGEHSESVVEMARGVARQLGIDEREVEIVAAAALLHDIGKVAIPDAVLNKPTASPPPNGS